MVARPDNDVERALKAFGDLSLKYRSFGAIPLRIGGAPLSDQQGQPSLDGMSFDPMGTDAPSSAAETYSLLGSALTEARDVRVAPRRTAPATSYVPPATWSAAPEPPSLMGQALGASRSADAGEPDRWQAYTAPPRSPAVYVPLPDPPVQLEPVSAPIPPAAPWEEAPAVVGPIPEPVFEPPVYAAPAPAVVAAPSPVAVDQLPTIFGRMRVAPPPPRSVSEIVYVPEAEPAAALVPAQMAPFAPIDQPVHVPIAPDHAPLILPPLARRAPIAQRQPLAGLFRSLAQPTSTHPAPDSPDTESPHH